MNLLASLRRPEYIFRPTQIVRRLLCEFGDQPAGYVTVRLPWGLPIRVQPNEVMGGGIRRLGIHELASSECIGRLIDPGELAVDVGANIGHMSSIMAMRAGPGGQVMAFEPHPTIFNELQYNIAAWKQNPKAAPIAAHNLALSDHAGTAMLMVPEYFEVNHGVCSLASDEDRNLPADHLEASMTTLTAVMGESRQIGLLKIDVEGHEFQVLLGAQGLLRSGSVRDILFEDFGVSPTPVTDLLHDSGYTIYRIVLGGLLGPIVAPIKTYHAPMGEKDSPNYIATRDVRRLLARMSKRGWMVYSNKW